MVPRPVHRNRIPALIDPVTDRAPRPQTFHFCELSADMTRRLSSSTPLFTALLIALFATACDFQAVEDAFDEFQIVIGLEPIASPVAGVVYNINSGEPIRATLTFGGAGASSLIDAYSDPLPSQLDVEGGALTFGVSNAVRPSSSSPFTFTVTAEAQGFYSQTRTVTATEVGGIDFEVPMVPEVNANSRIAGTSSAQDSRVQANENGSVQQTVVIQTQVNAESQATASATVSAGAVALSSTGQPLTGQLQTQIRAYDPGQGSTSLPQGATMSGAGSNQAVIGGIFFSMTDANGQSAASFTGSGSGKAVAGKSGACEQAGGFLELTISITDPAVIAAVQSLGSVNAEIWGYTPADGANNQLGSTPLTLNGAAVEGTVCAGGTLANVDLNNLGDVAQGAFFTLVLPPSVGTTSPLNLSLTIANPSGASIPGSITLQGPGMYANRSLSFPGSTKTRTLAEWLGVSGDYFIVNGGSYSIIVQPDGGSPETASISDPSSGSTTINLSAAAATITYTVEASFTCPAGTTFDVAVDDSSLDGVSVFYRHLPDGSPKVIPNDENVIKDTDQSTYIRVEAQLSGIPGEQYEFTGVLDNSQAVVETTAPAQANWTITLDSDDVGVGCN